MSTLTLIPILRPLVALRATPTHPLISRRLCDLHAHISAVFPSVHTAKVPLEICGDDGEPRRSVAWCRDVIAADDHHGGIPGERGSDLTLEIHDVDKAGENQVFKGGSRQEGGPREDNGTYDENKERGQVRQRRRLQATIRTHTSDNVNVNDLASEMWDASSGRESQLSYARRSRGRRRVGHRRALESQERSRRDDKLLASEGWGPTRRGSDPSLSGAWESSMTQGSAPLSRTRGASGPSRRTRARVVRDPNMFQNGERRGSSKRTGEYFGPSSEFRVGVDAPKVAAGARANAQIQLHQRRGSAEDTVPARRLEGQRVNGDQQAGTSHESSSDGKGEDGYLLDVKACFAWIPEDPCEQVDHPGVVGEASRYWVWAATGGVWRPGGPDAEAEEKVMETSGSV